MKAGDSRRRGAVLADRLGSRDNAVGLVRLTLALLVIFGHAFPLGGFAPAQVGPFIHSGLHGLAVEGFFVLSGYLILASGLRTTLPAFLWRRFLRIYPGWLAAIVLTAFLFAPLGALIEPGARWEARSAVGYVLGALDLKPSQEGVVDTLTAVPWPHTWNGSLWTLFYEALAYLGVALLCCWGPVRRRLKLIVPILCGIGTALYLFAPAELIMGLVPGAPGGILVNGIRLWTFFGWGMLACLWADRLRVTPALGIGSGAVFLLSVHQTVLTGPAAAAVVLLSLVTTVLVASALIPSRIGSVNDLSYGVYVYAFPVQQVLILLGVAQLGYWATALACVICVLPLAFLSWRVLEKPALSLKTLVSGRSGAPAARNAP